MGAVDDGRRVKRNCLFVGGHMDGKFMTVSSPIVVIPYMGPEHLAGLVSYRYEEDATPPSEFVSYEMETYVHARMSDGSFRMVEQTRYRQANDARDLGERLASDARWYDERGIYGVARQLGEEARARFRAADVLIRTADGR